MKFNHRYFATCTSILAIAVSAFSMVSLGGCENDAKVASYNLSQAADNFQINRRIVFLNTNTDTYAFEVEGLCSIDKGESIEREITVTCKTGPNEYKKHFLAISQDLTFFAEQLDPAPANTYHYKVTFKPSLILPTVEIR
jgi:hypothetical protein